MFFKVQAFYRYRLLDLEKLGMFLIAIQSIEIYVFRAIMPFPCIGSGQETGPNMMSKLTK